MKFERGPIQVVTLVRGEAGHHVWTIDVMWMLSAIFAGKFALQMPQRCTNLLSRMT